MGVLTYEQAMHSLDYLWLATSTNDENYTIKHLIPHSELVMKRSKLIRIDYPADQGICAFREIGFNPINSLVWMERRL